MPLYVGFTDTELLKWLKSHSSVDILKWLKELGIVTKFEGSLPLGIYRRKSGRDVIRQVSWDKWISIDPFGNSSRVSYDGIRWCLYPDSQDTWVWVLTDDHQIPDRTVEVTFDQDGNRIK